MGRNEENAGKLGGIEELYVGRRVFLSAMRRKDSFTTARRFLLVSFDMDEIGNRELKLSDSAGSNRDMLL